MTGPQASYLRDGRLHLNHGPIDLVIMVEGPNAGTAFKAAIRRFETLLQELVDELPMLRSPDNMDHLTGRVACRMRQAVIPYLPVFITPMAAVAGAVADEILSVIQQTEGVSRAAVNNGGDIALYLPDGAEMTISISSDLGALWGKINLSGCDNIRGVATSGRGGRSLSMGIADSVTVLAESAAQADAAATLIANACDLPDHPLVTRDAAYNLHPDSDLGARLVVTDCAELCDQDKGLALERAFRCADDMMTRGLIAGAAVFLQGNARFSENRDVTFFQEKGYLCA